MHAFSIGLVLVAQVLVVPAAAAAEPQVIDFTLPDEGVVGASVPLTGSASSGLPVEYASTTGATCAVDGSTLELLEPGTCEVTASQPGDADWLPADPVASSIRVKLPPYTTPDGATLGRYALNGTVRAMAIDGATGITYVAGDFTQVGIRTGAVALVHPPGSGSDLLIDGSADVVSDQLTLFADDETGYFMAGAIGSTNGDGVHRFGITRMTAAGTIDPTWHSTDPCSSGLLPTWDLGDRMAAPLGLSDGSGLSTVGLAFIAKSSGVMSYVGGAGQGCSAATQVWPSVSVFPPLAACAGWSICVGHIQGVTRDAARNLLVTDTYVISRQTPSSEHRIRHYLVAYDTAAGARLWSRELENPVVPPDFPPQATWGGESFTMGVLDGAVLVLGHFPFGDSNATRSTMLLVDSATGAVLQRWSPDGEQDLADPAVVVAAPSVCTPADAWTDSAFGRFVRVDGSTAVGYASPSDVEGGRQFSVCAYSTAGSGADRHLVADELGTFLAVPDPANRFHLPHLLHGDRYLVGPNGAFDLQANGAVGGWNPAPSGAPQSLLSMGDSIVLGGGISFIHGTTANHVAALDEDLEPIDTFVADLPDTANDGNAIQSVRQLALLDGRLIVTGDLKGTFGRGPVVALDAATGEITWSYDQPVLADGLALAPDPGTGAFYLGMWRSYAGPLLERFVPSGDGYAVDGAFSHTIGAYDGDRYVSGLALIGNRLYIGGEFGSVDGEARQGLARLTNGVLDAWDPAMIDELDPGEGDIVELQPFRFVELGSRVVVGGNFHRIITSDGGGTTVSLSSVVAYDATTGARVRPVGTNEAWFPDDDWAFDMVVIGQTLYVAMGTGVGAFDATTLDYLPTRSSRTQPGWGESAILTLGAAPANAAAAGLSASATTTTPLVMGGDLASWSNRSAGNVVETLPFDRVSVAFAGLGKGTVSSTPAGLSCSASCNRNFPLGSAVTLKATPVAGATFIGWSGACSGTGTCTVQVTAARSVTATFADKAKPIVAGLTTSVRGGGTLSSTYVPLRIAWSSSDPGGSGVKRYELARSTNGGISWSTVSTSLTTPSLNLGATMTGSVRYRVRAVDKAGNIGAWVTGPTLRPALIQQSSATVNWFGTWTTIADATTSGGSVRYSKAAGASATYSFTGRAVGFVTTMAPTRGLARFYVNGALVATVDLRSSTEKDRYVAWQMRWGTSATRTVKVVVVGTAGRPRVDVDAFVIIR